MMEVFDSGADLSWSQRDPSAKKFKCLWQHSYQLWKSRYSKKAQDVMLSIQESACPGVEVPPPQTPIPAPRTPVPTTKKESTDKDTEWGKTEVDRWLTKIHVNCGHAPSAQMAHCLKEAGYDKKIIS